MPAETDDLKREVDRLLNAIALHRREADPGRGTSPRDQKLYAAIGFVQPEIGRPHPGGVFETSTSGEGEPSAAERSLVYRVKCAVGYGLTCKLRNTDEWMRGFVKILNGVIEATGDDDRFYFTGEEFTRQDRSEQPAAATNERKT